MNTGHRLLFVLTVTYVVLALAYAFATPPWQNPDEPAHYNYARDIADNGRLPVLQVGDYDQDELERLKASKFANNPDISRIRYESYQPPLYYVAGATAMVLVPGKDNDLYALRLLSVLCGVVLLSAVFVLGRDVLPDVPAAAVVSTAIVAFIPQHMAMTAAANNDTLGELLLTAMALLAVKRVKGLHHGRFAAVGAVLLGLALLTKVTAYVGAVLLAAGELGYWRLHDGEDKTRPGAAWLAAVLGGLAIGGWWFARNAVTYGGMDILGLARHDQVVVGQPRTALGLAAVQHFLIVTFRSFWAQFGWMGVLVDARVYGALALLSAAALTGLALWAVRCLGRLPSWQKWALGILALQFTLIAAIMVLYNVTFIQPQGRYLFPASAGIAIFMFLGLHEMVERPRLLAALVLVGSVALGMMGLGKLFAALGVAASAAVLGARWRLPDRYRAVLWGALVTGLAMLDVVCLVWFVVPFLT